MAFNLRHMFLFVLAISAAMFLATQFHPAATLLTTTGLALPMAFFFPKSRRRPFFYGGMAGIIVGFVLSSVLLSMAYRQHPREPIAYGPNANSGQTQAPQVQRTAQQALNPYIVTIGFVVGATTGLVVSSRKLATSIPRDKDTRP